MVKPTNTHPSPGHTSLCAGGLHSGEGKFQVLQQGLASCFLTAAQAAAIRLALPFGESPALTRSLVTAVPAVTLPVAAPGVRHALVCTGTGPLPGAAPQLLGVAVLWRQRGTQCHWQSAPGRGSRRKTPAFRGQSSSPFCNKAGQSLHRDGQAF